MNEGVTDIHMLSDKQKTNKGFPKLEMKPDDYLEELKDWDVPEEQKIEFLQTLWNIMSAFVDLGWGVDSVQMVLPDIFGDKPLGDSEKSGPDSGNLLEQKNIKNFNQSAREE